MYLGLILGLMVVLPIGSVIVESIARPGADIVFLVGKWFVFWMGVRLLSAGFSQMLRPGFTSSGIFGMTEKDAEKIVVELGFGNTAIGLAAVLSIFYLGWVTPMALVGVVFLGLAGLAHVRNTGKSMRENIALYSDIFVALVLAGYLIAVAFITTPVAG